MNSPDLARLSVNLRGAGSWRCAHGAPDLGESGRGVCEFPSQRPRANLRG